jgi:hypothetical protein
LSAKKPPQWYGLQGLIWQVVKVRYGITTIIAETCTLDRLHQISVKKFGAIVCNKSFADIYLGILRASMPLVMNIAMPV